MYGLRKTPQARVEAADVQDRHGSRKSGLPASGQRRKTQTVRLTELPSPQGELFT